MAYATELTLGAALVAALAAGALALLAKPAPSFVAAPLPQTGTAVVRAKPLDVNDRLAHLERRLMEVAAEQRRLIADLKAATRERTKR